MKDEGADSGMSGEAISALEQLPADLALVKVENQTMMAAAVARPRDLEAIAKGLRKQIVDFPDFARVVLYSRPVGKDESGKMKFASGLSIRAAEAVAEAYGFNRISSSIKILPDGNAEVTGSFTDFQRCRVVSASIVVSRSYKSRGGKMVTHPADRFADVVCKAAQSKVIRDVIVRSVPPALKATLELAARSAVRLDEKAVAKIVEYFAGLGVEAAELEATLGASRSGWTDAHRQQLLEISAAIKEEEATVEDVFGPRRKADGSAPQVARAAAAAARALLAQAGVALDGHPA